MSVMFDYYLLSNYSATRSVQSAGYTKVGQSFACSVSGHSLDNAVLRLAKVGLPTGTATVSLFSHSGTFGTSSVGTGTALVTSDTLDVSTLTTSMASRIFTFSTPYELTSGTNYVLAIEYSGGNASNYVNIGCDNTTPTHSGNYSYYTGTTWTANSSYDVIFYAYGSPTGATLLDSYPYANYNTYQSVYNTNVVKVGQSFQWAGTGMKLSHAGFYLLKAGSPTGNVTARLYSHTGTYGTSSVGTTLLATSGTLDIATFTSATHAPYTFTFTDNYVPSNGAYYVITCEYSGGDATNQLRVGVDNSTPSHAGNFCYYTSSWSSSSANDTIFYVYGLPATSRKTINGLALASVKTVNGLAIASVKTIDGLA